MADEGKTIIHVTVEAGAEFVQEKHVEYQIGKVEAGGIGVQVVQGGAGSGTGSDGSSKGSGASGTSASNGGSQPKIKVVASVFTYKWVKKHPGRLTDFYQYLVKLHAIDKDTDHVEFENLFSGVPTDIIVKWIAPKSALYALMKELKERGFIEPAGKVWVVTQSHFKGADDALFTDLRNQHAPEYLAWIIRMIADTLDPKVEVKPLTEIDDDLADELWSGVKDKAWEVNH